MLKINYRNLMKIASGGLAFVLVGVGIGRFSKNNNSCNVPFSHTHTYINSLGYSINLAREEKEIQGFKKQSNYDLTFEYDENIEKLLLENGYVLISDNLPLIEHFEKTMPKYSEDGKILGFYGYRVDLVDNQYVFTKSPYVTSLYDIIFDYPYIKMDAFSEYVDEDLIYGDYESAFDDDLDTDNSWFEDEEEDPYLEIKIYSPKRL